MKVQVVSFVGWSILLISMSSIGMLIVPEDKPQQSNIDIANPETWDQTVQQAMDNVDKTADDLILVATDKERTSEDRRKAIFLLGKISSKKSIAFLLNNVSLRIPMETIKGDEDELKTTPCRYSLSELSSKDWNIAVAIFDKLNNAISEADSGGFSFVLQRILGRKLSRAILNDMNGTNSSDVLRKNIQTLLRHLEE